MAAVFLVIKVPSTLHILRRSEQARCLRATDMNNFSSKFQKISVWILLLIHNQKKIKTVIKLKEVNFHYLCSSHFNEANVMILRKTFLTAPSR